MDAPVSAGSELLKKRIPKRSFVPGLKGKIFELVYTSVSREFMKGVRPGVSDWRRKFYSDFVIVEVIVTLIRTSRAKS